MSFAWFGSPSSPRLLPASRNGGERPDGRGNVADRTLDGVHLAGAGDLYRAGRRIESYDIVSCLLEWDGVSTTRSRCPAPGLPPAHTPTVRQGTSPPAGRRTARHP